MFASIEKVKELIVGNAPVIVAGDESLLRSLPKGNWIGGTIPYFMTPEGGRVSHTQVFVTEVPDFVRGVRIEIYDERTISRIGADSPENGYTIVILPAFSVVHRLFALEAPSYEQLFFKVVAGWIAGTHLQDIGKIAPKAFAGPIGESLADKGVAMHIDLPRGYQAKIVHQHQAVTLKGVFDHAEECLLDGRRPLRLAGVHELPGAQKHASADALHGLQNRCLTGASRATEHCHRTHGKVIEQAVDSLLLSGSESDFEIHWISPSRVLEKHPKSTGSTTKWENRT